MTKELIIIALVILLIYLYYQKQNQQIFPEEPAKINQLKSEITHYQNLYQKRVAKDLDDEEKAKELTGVKQNLEQKLNLTQQDLKSSQEQTEELEILLTNQQQATNEQLRKLNLLFDANAVNYETVDFNGLYSLCQQIA